MSEKGSDIVSAVGLPVLPEAVRSAWLSFSNAERAIESYEAVSLENQLSALNELRYSGSHFLKAVQAESRAAIPFERYNDDVYCAKKHSDRALNDVIDSSILVSLEFIREFLDKQYTERELRDSAFFNYPDDFNEIMSVKKLLEDIGMAKEIKKGSHEDLCLKRFRLLRLKMEKTLAELDAYRANADLHREEDKRIERLRKSRVMRVRAARFDAQKKRRDKIAFTLSLLAFAQTIWGCSILQSKLKSWISESEVSQGIVTEAVPSSDQAQQEHTNGKGSR